MADELKPCPNPWCEAQDRDGDYRPRVQYSNFGMVYVSCTSCTMAGSTRQHEHEAIAAWNRRPSAWQDIASAPKDFEPVLVWAYTEQERDDAEDEGRAPEHSCLVAMHSDIQRGVWWLCGSLDTVHKATHWQPLPTPPVGEQ